MPLVKILGTRVDCLSRLEVEQKLQGFLRARHPHFVVTANAEMYYAAYHDQDLREVLNTADLLVPDSVGIIYALEKQGARAELYPGVELAQYLLSTGAPVYVLGATQSVLDKLSLGNIVGKHHGFFSAEEEPALLKDIQRCRPQILLVALGVGKQERFIARYKQALGVPVMVGVGGAIDVLAGAKKRAPFLFRKLHLEWLFRLLVEPQRIFRQYKLVLYWLAVQRCSE
jgi:N-acetylglucosaminyldiphosphoundecaprenol N-acetyl-beta-D-mannosaminyltransferase